MLVGLGFTGDGSRGIGNGALVLAVDDGEVEAGKVDVQVQVVGLLRLGGVRALDLPECDAVEPVDLGDIAALVVLDQAL